MDNGLKMFILTLVILAGSMAVLYLVIGLRSFAKKKREIQRVPQYREKYISEITLIDSRFGYLKGEYDCCKRRRYHRTKFGHGVSFCVRCR